MSEPEKFLTVAKIIPGVKKREGLPHLTRGTRVMLSDGSFLGGVTKIKLTADTNDLWRAEITLMPDQVLDIDALAEIKTEQVLNEQD